MDGQIPQQEELRFGPPAQGRLHSRRQLGRREGLDDVVGRSGLQGLGDRLVAAVGGDEDDRQIGQLGNALHQLDTVASGQQQVQQDQMGPVRLDEAGYLPRVARQVRRVAGLREGIPNEPQCERVVVDHQDACRLPRLPGSGATARQDAGRGAVDGLFGHRNREGEPRAPARPIALGPDAAPVGLDQSLRDGQAQAGSPDAALLLLSAGQAGMLAEQVRQLIRRHALALVGHRDRDENAVPRRGDPDGRRLGRAPGGVREEVVEDLDNALMLGHHPRQVGWKVDLHLVPAASAQEGIPGLVHQTGHFRGLGVDAEHAGLDAPGIEQISDQAVDLVGVLLDDAEELAHLGRIEDARGAARGCRRALDGGERGAQLVAHQPQELGPRALQILEGRQILHGHHHRLDHAVHRRDRRGVEQCRDAPAVGHRENDLLGAHRVEAVRLVLHRELVERDLPPIGVAAHDHLMQLLRRNVRRAQALDNPPRLAIE